MFDLDGRVAVVTGGSKGIGRMIAEELVRRGVRTYITARHADVCLQTAAELSEAGECIGIPNDMSTVDGIGALAKDLARREDGLDILVNNAGTGWVAPFDDFPEKGWDKAFNVNLKGPIPRARSRCSTGTGGPWARPRWWSRPSTTKVSIRMP